MKAAVLTLTIALLTMTGTAAREFRQDERPAVPKVKGKPSKAAPAEAVGTNGRLSSVQQTLRRNPALANRIAERLPARIDVFWASSGFRNLGQFVAAVNAADNLQIPFMTLKSRMLDDGMSLDRAIRDLRPSADYRKEVRRAERDAQAMISGR
jgi:hypothetical protein